MQDLDRIKTKLLTLLAIEEQSYELFLFPNHYDALFQVHFSNYISAARCGKNHFLTTMKQKDDLHFSLQVLEKLDCHVKELSFDSSFAIDKKSWQEALSVRTACVSLMVADSCVGSMIDVSSLSQLLQSHNTPLHIDITPLLVAGEVEVDLHGVEWISGALEDSGFVLMHKDMDMHSMRPSFRDEMKEKKLVERVDSLLQQKDSEMMRLASLQQKLHLLWNKLPGSFCLQPERSLLKKTVLGFENVHAEALRYELKKKEGEIGWQIEPCSFFLRTCGIDPQTAYSAFSLDLSSMSVDQVEEFVQECKRCYDKLSVLTDQIFTKSSL